MCICISISLSLSIHIYIYIYTYIHIGSSGPDAGGRAARPQAGELLLEAHDVRIPLHLSFASVPHSRNTLKRTKLVLGEVPYPNEDLVLRVAIILFSMKFEAFRLSGGISPLTNRSRLGSKPHPRLSRFLAWFFDSEGSLRSGWNAPRGALEAGGP